MDVQPNELQKFHTASSPVFLISNSHGFAERRFMKPNLLLCVVLGFCTFGFAKDKGDVRDITGCLMKGDSAKEFLLKGTDGSTWEVRSTKVALAEHMGHTVTATGVVSNAKLHNMKEDTQETVKDSGLTEKNKEHGHMKITDLKMVSDSCK
jgi:hypothetical protein